jgi:hypothetical protein
MFTAWMIDPSDLFTAQVLTVSGGATPTLTSTITLVRQLTKLNVFVANAGTSTSCTVTIYGKPTATSLLSSTLAVFTLGAGTALVPYTAGRYIEELPSFVYAVITNADAVAGHTAIITVTLDMVR